MCGIAGAMFAEGSRDERDAPRIVSVMVDALSHRGPDGRGVAVCSPRFGTNGRRVVLGHRRLAILDLSERGAQPMQLPGEPIWITFNGEIYNFKAIRADLEAAGRAFRSDSDTEVVLQGYDEWGLNIVDRLQGMFAIAIWDGRADELYLIRDRLGIKPLYLYEHADGVLFASEIRALLGSGVVPRRLNRGALDNYLAYQTVPCPETLIDGVRMLPPGHLAVCGPQGVTERCYWDLLDDRSIAAEAADPAEAVAHVAELLERSALLHQVSDVPVGIFLSGGIDSSALVALTRKTGSTPRTFSIALPGTPHDETVFARAIARRFESVHEEIPVTAAELRNLTPEALGRVDHPSGDGINTFVISRAVRSAGIKVALSGLGGDEFFGGYPSFDRLEWLSRYGGVWQRSPASIRQMAAAAVRAIGGSVSSDKAAALLEGDGTLPQTFLVMRQVFSPADRRELLGREVGDAASEAADPYVRLLEDAMARHPEATVRSLVSYAEARTYMHDVLLRDSDQMSMAHGLELRVPLLDHRLVQYVMGLPDEAKQPRGIPKRLLVESVGTLPAECVERRKQGFVLPFDAWMKGELREFCEHHLGGGGLVGRGIVEATAVGRLWQAYLGGDRSTSWSRPWTLVALDAWLEQNGLTA